MTMDKLSGLIRELHRRSIWQVLGVFLAASWGVLQVVEVMTETVGLPDWTPSMAFVALLLGLPMVLATAFIQEGLPGADPATPDADTSDGETPANLAPGTGSLDRPSTRPSARRRLFTWRNAGLGGLGAFTLLGMSLVAYFVMWTTGIGPVGNLAAQGVFEDGEPVILADFVNRSNDPSLGGVVTESLRVDLTSSRAMTLVAKSRVQDVLGLMQADPTQPLTATIAREVAIRDGIKAIVEGEVGAAGSGYILVATLTEAQSGTPLATFRRTAKGPDDVIGAIDGLSQDIREKTGESLRAIKSGPPLDHVTTTSIDALRKFAEAERLSDDGAYARAKALLEEAVALDPAFAMAWRKLSVVLQTLPGGDWTQAETALRAYELRDRLTEVERASTVAWYHKQVTGDQIAEIQAYENLLATDPDNPQALNNLSITLSDRTRHEEATALLERAVAGPGESAPAHVNLIAAYGNTGRLDEGWGAYERMLDRYPARDTWPVWDRWYLQAVGGEWEASMETAREMIRGEAGPNWRSVGAWMLGVSLAASGDMTEAAARFSEDHRIATTDGRALEASWQIRYLADTQWLTGGAEEGRRVAAEHLRSGEFERVPAAERSWVITVEMFLRMGMLDEAGAVLDIWQRDMGSLAGSALREARRMADAAALDDPAARIAELVRLRDEMNCPRCFDWWLAELSEEDGDGAAAIDFYASAMSMAHSEKMLFPVMRVVGHERLGRLHEAQGDPAAAARHYTAFADAWADAESGLQERVRVARDRARLLASR
jgi:tetratricopeptide (TPR) repeat protein